MMTNSPLNVVFVQEAHTLHLSLEKAFNSSWSATESGGWAAIQSNGCPNWERISRSTKDLAGAARAVELPVVELVAVTLDDVARRLDRVKAPLAQTGVQTFREAVSILGQEIQAFANGTSGVESSRAFSIVGKLEAIVF